MGGEAIKLLANGTVSLQTDRPSISGQVWVKNENSMSSSASEDAPVVLINFELNPTRHRVSCNWLGDPKSERVGTSDCENIVYQWAKVTSSSKEIVLSVNRPEIFFTDGQKLTDDGLITLSRNLSETIDATFLRGTQMLKEHNMAGAKVPLVSLYM